jgi:hypothetical protein
MFEEVNRPCVRDAKGSRRLALPARPGRIAEAIAKPGAARPRWQRNGAAGRRQRGHALRIKKNLVVIIISLAICGAPKPAFSQRYLAADAGRKRVYFREGESVRLKLKGEDYFTLRQITAIRDSVVVLDNKMSFRPVQIEALKVPARKQKFRVLKSLSLYGGAALPVLSAANGLLFGHRPLFTPWSLATGGALLGTYGVLMAVTHVPRTVRNGQGNRIKIIIVEPMPKNN